MTDVATPQPAETAVPVQLASGEVGTVASKDLKQVLGQGGKLVTHAELDEANRQAQLEKEYGGLGGAAKAAGLGALRGATVGLSDPLLVGLGGESTRRVLAGYQEANPLASIGGEVAGAIAPAFIPGGQEGILGAAGKAISAPTRALGAAGRLAESGAAAVVGTGARSAIGRIAQRAAIGATGAALEGAAYGVGHELSDSAIQNHELTAEKLWAGAGKGALIGGLVGGGIGGLGQTGKELVGYAAGKLNGGSLAQYLERISAERAWQSAGPSKQITKRAEAYADGGFENVGRIWRDEAPALAGKRSFSNMTQEDLAVAATKGLEKHGQRLIDALDTADQAIAKAGTAPKALDVIGDIDRVADKLERTQIGSAPAVQRLRSIADDTRRVMGFLDDAGIIKPGAQDATMTVREMHELRKSVDRAISPGSFGPELAGFKKELFSVRRALEDRIENAVEGAGGKALRGTYETAKQKAQAYYLLQDSVKNATAGSGANRFFGLSEQLGGIVGGQVGGLLGGPVGGMAGAGVGSLVAKAVKSRGDFVAADVLDKVARLGGIERAAQRIDRQVDQGVSAWLDGTKRAARVLPIKAEQDFQERAIRTARAVSDVATSDNAMRVHLAQKLGPIGQYAPDIAAHASIQATRTLGYLAANAPAAKVSVPSLTPQLEKERYSYHDLVKFMRRVDVAENPLKVLNKMIDGRLSRTEVETVATLYPGLHQQMKDAVLEQVQKRGKKLPYDQRMQAKILFGIDADPTTTGAFIASQQRSAAQAGPEPTQEQAQPMQKLGGRRPVEIDTDSYQTPMEQLNQAA